MDERIGQTVTVDGTDYRILRLLGKGKGGYSYLAEAPGGEQVTVKQIHHEPCAYYQFGDKLAAELNDYRGQHRGFQFELLETYLYYPNTDPEQFVGRLEEQRRH